MWCLYISVWFSTCVNVACLCVFVMTCACVRVFVVTRVIAGVSPLPAGSPVILVSRMISFFSPSFPFCLKSLVLTSVPRCSDKSFPAETPSPRRVLGSESREHTGRLNKSLRILLRTMYDTTCKISLKASSRDLGPPNERQVRRETRGRGLHAMQTNK